jgi:hypothetical protein
VFDATRRQGGVAGYAHVNRELFTVRRDMSLNIPRGKVDFAEIAEFGNVKPDLYYEFLNIGFRLAAAGGSDVPWGGTAGDARTYVHTGSSRFTPDAWLAGLRQGHTFVTLGPMLEFTVEGKLPGDEVRMRKGETIAIRARVSAGYSNRPPGRIEVVGNGDVLRSSESGEIEFTLLAGHSLWLAARTRDAHTSPVYLVDPGRRRSDRPPGARSGWDREAGRAQRGGAAPGDGVEPRKPVRVPARREPVARDDRRGAGGVSPVAGFVGVRAGRGQRGRAVTPAHLHQAACILIAGDRP